MNDQADRIRKAPFPIADNIFASSDGERLWISVGQPEYKVVGLDIKAFIGLLAFSLIAWPSNKLKPTYAVMLDTIQIALKTADMIADTPSEPTVETDVAEDGAPKPDEMFVVKVQTALNRPNSLLIYNKDKSVCNEFHDIPEEEMAKTIVEFNLKETGKSYAWATINEHGLVIVDGVIDPNNTDEDLDW